MKLNWNFLGGRGYKTKNLPWGACGYFLALRNMTHHGALGSSRACRALREILLLGLPSKIRINSNFMGVWKTQT